MKLILIYIYNSFFQTTFKLKLNQKSVLIFRRFPQLIQFKVGFFRFPNIFQFFKQYFSSIDQGLDCFS